MSHLEKFSYDFLSEEIPYVKDSILVKFSYDKRDPLTHQAMVEYVNHPLFHAVWDTGHANMQDMPQDEALRLLGSHVRALHVQDNMGDADSHLVPFLGTMNMDSVMNGLLDIGYDGYFTFEVGGFFLPADKRRSYERDQRLAGAPLDLRRAFERYLYQLGKCVLEAYGCYEI